MEVIDIQAVKDCLAEVSDCEDKQYAIALLEWAIGKRTFDLAEHDKQIRADVIAEYKYDIVLFREMFLEELEKQAVDREEIFMYRDICSMAWNKYLEQLKEQKDELSSKR